MSNIGLRVIKIIDIFCIGNIYMFLGVLVSSFMARYIAKPYDHTKSKLRNLLQLILEIGLLMVFVYAIRIIIKHYIPNPLKGIYGFDPNRVVELNGSVILAFAFLMYLKPAISSKVRVLYDFLSVSNKS